MINKLHNIISYDFYAIFYKWLSLLTKVVSQIKYLLCGRIQCYTDKLLSHHVDI